MDILKRFMRYTLKSPAIITNPPQPSKMVADPEGEYILVDQLVGAIQSNGLLIKTPELDEMFEDGKAQRALIRDLDKLGYEDFDTVMKVLRQQRDSVLHEREFEIWREGYQATGEHQTAQLVGKATAISFYETVVKLRKETPDNDWLYDEASGTWSSYGCQFYKTEAEARAFFG